MNAASCGLHSARLRPRSFVCVASSARRMIVRTDSAPPTVKPGLIVRSIVVATLWTRLCEGL